MRLLRRPAPASTDPNVADLPPAGADLSLFGTQVDVPHLVKVDRKRAEQVFRRAELAQQRRDRVAGARSRLRRAVRPSFVLMLDAVGVIGLIYSAWLIWTPIAWCLASVTCLLLASLIDRSTSGKA